MRYAQGNHNHLPIMIMNYRMASITFCRKKYNCGTTKLQVFPNWYKYHAFDWHVLYARIKLSESAWIHAMQIIPVIVYITCFIFTNNAHNYSIQNFIYQSVQLVHVHWQSAVLINVANQLQGRSNCQSGQWSAIIPINQRIKDGSANERLQTLTFLAGEGDIHSTYKWVLS